jgi:uncharacterized protein
METVTKGTQRNLRMPTVLLLIFAPSLLLMLIYIVIGPLFQDIMPSILLFYLIAIFTLFPIQLWVVLSASKAEYGTYSLKSAFSYHQKMAFWKVFLYGALLWGFAGIMSITVSPLEHRLFAPISERLLQAIPPYFNWANIEYLQRYSRGVLLLTAVIYFIFNAFVGPIIEELFFRGYLTAKISRFGDYAPFIMTVLFSLYHFWLPFDNLFRIIIFFPPAYLAWKKKNIYIPMVFHVLSNLFSSIVFIIAISNIL